MSSLSLCIGIMQSEGTGERRVLVFRRALQSQATPSPAQPSPAQRGEERRGGREGKGGKGGNIGIIDGARQRDH